MPKKQRIRNKSSTTFIFHVIPTPTAYLTVGEVFPNFNFF